MSTTLPPSAELLAKVLDEDGGPAKTIKERFHRTVLWRWLTGRRPPDLESATFVERATNGRVPASGWLPPTLGPSTGKAA